MMFKDRYEAGNLLAKELKDFSQNKNAIIITIPRGGLPIGFTLAKALQLPLDIVLSKKIGHPLHKEFAIGAVTLNDRLLTDDAEHVSKEYIEEETTKIRRLLKQRHDQYYGNTSPLSLKDKIVIVVDDGVATGQTLISSINLIEQQNPSQIIVALPVGPPSVIKKIRAMASIKKTICLISPIDFQAVGQFYEAFNPINDLEAIRLLRKSNQTIIKN